MKVFSGERSAALKQQLVRVFAEKEIFFRTQGRVRFLRIGSRLQIGVAALVLASAGGWSAVTLSMLYNQAAVASERAEVDAKAKSIALEARKVNAYKRSVSDIAEDLGKRQDALDDMVSSQFGPVGDDPSVVGHPDEKSSVEAAKPDDGKNLSAVTPSMERLREIESRQTRFARRLAALIDARAAKAEAAIRSFGLNPKQIAARNAVGLGGPYIPWQGGVSSDDDALSTLSKSLARLNALERGLVSIPSGKPTTSPMLTSSYGYRRDPFNGRAAFHAGIDFRGSYGQPILAAAAGRVSFVGRRQGYGKVVEIDHGNGMMTRYAHLAGFSARAGQKVTRGLMVGRMGSTGRSTGTHLHFEVRVNGAAINPRRFLEVRKDVLQVQQSAKQRFARVSAKNG